MAIFLAAALRSVGVPARVAGTPQWTDAKAIAKLAAGGGFQNHDWCVVRRSILGRHTLSLCWRR